MQPYRDIEDVFKAGKRAIAEEMTDKKLAAYLGAFVKGRLTTDRTEAMPSYETQRDRVLALIRKQYADGFGYHQTINGEIAGVPNFFEAILCMAYITREIELINLIYDNKEVAAGISTARKIPYAEFVVSDSKLKQQLSISDKVETPTAAPSIVSAGASNTPTTRHGRVIKAGRIVSVVIDGDKTYPIARLEASGTYDTFMDYILNAKNADIDISIEEINSLKGTLSSAKNLTELIRHSGFNRQLKLAFFPMSKGGKMRFSSVALLNDKQIEAVKTQSKKNKAKNRE